MIILFYFFYTALYSLFPNERPFPPPPSPSPPLPMTDTPDDPQCSCDLPQIVINELDHAKTIITIENSAMQSNEGNCSARSNTTTTATTKTATNGNSRGFMSELKEMAQKINQLPDLEGELTQALTRVKSQDEEMARFRQQVKKLETELRMRSGKVKELESRVCETNGHTAESAQRALAEVDQLRSQLAQLQEKNETLRNKLRSSEKSSHYYRTLSGGLEKTVESKRQIIEHLQQQSAQYLERLVEFEKSKMTAKYLDQCDAEEQLQAARMMLKEREFEIEQLCENFQDLESSVCENLQVIEEERKVQTTAIRQNGGGGGGKQKRGSNNIDNQQQLMRCTTPASGVGAVCHVTGCPSSLFDDVARNLHGILHKIALLKEAHPHMAAMTARGQARISCCAAVAAVGQSNDLNSDLENCTCDK